MRLAAHLFALGLVCLIASLTPLAFADPPDQTWLGGYWDNDDFDEVVVFITHSCGLVDVSAPHIPECQGVARLELPGVVVTPTADVGVFSPRAPPSVAPAV
jgi:hypothetical protein